MTVGSSTLGRRGGGDPKLVRDLTPGEHARQIDERVDDLRQTPPDPIPFFCVGASSGR